MRESFVRFRHTVYIFAFLDSVTFALRCIDDFASDLGEAFEELLSAARGEILVHDS